MAIDLGDVANLGTAIAVGAGVVFGVVQIRGIERKRRDAATIQIIQTHQSAEFVRALRVLERQPATLEAAQVQASPDLEDAAMTAGIVYETLGILVFERVIALDALDRMMGGSIRANWRRLRPFVESLRGGSPKTFEWFQWLAERLEERAPLERTVGAYELHRAWRE